nr:D-beta-hydroxybutyrate dehydrogenase, mitochondrial-like [Procambarus clarkii]
MVVTLDEAGDVLLCGGVSAALCSLLHLLGLSCSTCWLLFTTVWLLTGVTCFLLSTLKVCCEGKVVLVTGCDSGFGNTLALHLDKLGFRVIACCLGKEGEGVQRLRDEGSPRLHPLQLDVTSQDQLKTAVINVKKLIPEGEELWGLVNNAGISTFGEVEWVPDATYRKVLEVNLLGTVAATKTFLPLIRRAKVKEVAMKAATSQETARCTRKLPEMKRSVVAVGINHRTIQSALRH